MSVVRTRGEERIQTASYLRVPIFPWVRANFAKFFDLYGNKKLAITTHLSADLDGVCSAFALSRLLPKTVIVFQDEPHMSSAAFINMMGIEVISFGHLPATVASNLNGVIVVDTPSSWRVPFVRNGYMNNAPIVLLLDHHEKHDHDLHADYEIMYPMATSTCEILFRLLSNDLISPDIAFSLLVGAFSDAKNADRREEIKGMLASLLKISERSIAEVDRCVNPPLDCIALKERDDSLSNLRTQYYKGFTFAYTSVGMDIKSNVADILMGRGYDFVIVTFTENGRCTSSIRFGPNVKFDASLVAHKLGRSFDGNGGGHYNIAGALTRADGDDTYNRFFELIKDLIDSRPI